MPKREIDRARGLVMITLATKSKNRLWASRAEQYLVPADIEATDYPRILEAIGDDLPVLEALGAAYLLTERPQVAVQFWQKALEYNPEFEPVLSWLSVYYHMRQDWTAAKSYLDRLLSVNPFIASFHGRRAHVLGYLGKMNEAIESAERSIELDPTDLQTHEWLITAYEQTGQSEKSRQQQDLYERLYEARPY